MDVMTMASTHFPTPDTSGSTDGFASLKQRHRHERDGYPEFLDLRVHRALSWLHRAEQCDDDDGAFIFLWISLNAAWDYHNQKPDIEEWQISFNRARDQSKSALANQKTADVLNIVMDRLYTLRNQLVHGGATWNGKVNRSQVRDGRNILPLWFPLLLPS